MRYPKYCLLIVSILFCAAVDFARAEVFVLSTGGRVVGELVNRDENPRKKYIIELEDGSRVTLDAAQVEQVQRPKAELLEYEKIRADYPDTVEGQWALAEWCREKKLPAQRDTHLKRIIELDPDHADARRALGYNKDRRQMGAAERPHGRARLRLFQRQVDAAAGGRATGRKSETRGRPVRMDAKNQPLAELAGHQARRRGQGKLPQDRRSGGASVRSSWGCATNDRPTCGCCSSRC